ncbi:MAG: hypothetical protein PVJ27_01440 [Candidatus Brocadiaceae bacterium]|jgi:GGDEF domain-containing protein
MDSFDDRDEGNRDDELERLYRRFSSVDKVWEVWRVRTFLDRLVEEADRSQRYNHFFSVLVVRARKQQAEEVYRRLKGQLRRSDMMEILPASPAWEQAEVEPEVPLPEGTEVAAILPETNRAGAKAAVERLRTFLVNAGSVGFGLAVFPDDGTDGRQLLRKADAAA